MLKKSTYNHVIANTIPTVTFDGANVTMEIVANIIEEIEIFLISDKPKLPTFLPSRIRAKMEMLNDDNLNALLYFVEQAGWTIEKTDFAIKALGEAYVIY